MANILPEPDRPNPVGQSPSSGLAVDSHRSLPLWYNAIHAKHIVKGNLMTLSARPKSVELGEWIAHQAVEHYRIVWNFARVVYEKEGDGTSICNPQSCPRMSAGPNLSYRWLDMDHQPVELPARDYMTLMQRWISGSVEDETTFPTDPHGTSFALHPEYPSPGLPMSDEWLGSRSGFPKQFAETCRSIFVHVFRVYAHLYWNHFSDPIYHLNLEKQLNSCFGHFLLTATNLNLLTKEDIKPMQRLIDLWAEDGTFPRESKVYAYANLA